MQQAYRQCLAKWFSSLFFIQVCLLGVREGQVFAAPIVPLKAVLNWVANPLSAQLAASIQNLPIHQHNTQLTSLIVYRFRPTFRSYLQLSYEKERLQGVKSNFTYHPELKTYSWHTVSGGVGLRALIYRQVLTGLHLFLDQAIASNRVHCLFTNSLSDLAQKTRSVFEISQCRQLGLALEVLSKTGSLHCNLNWPICPPQILSDNLKLSVSKKFSTRLIYQLPLQVRLVPTFQASYSHCFRETPLACFLLPKLNERFTWRHKFKLGGTVRLLSSLLLEVMGTLSLGEKTSKAFQFCLSKTPVYQIPTQAQGVPFRKQLLAPQWSQCVKRSHRFELGAIKTFPVSSDTGQNNLFFKSALIKAGFSQTESTRLLRFNQALSQQGRYNAEGFDQLPLLLPDLLRRANLPECTSRRIIVCISNQVGMFRKKLAFEESGNFGKHPLKLSLYRSEDHFLALLKNTGRKSYLVDVAANGNCLFNALALCLSEANQGRFPGSIHPSWNSYQGVKLRTQLSQAFQGMLLSGQASDKQILQRFVETLVDVN